MVEIRDMYVTRSIQPCPGWLTPERLPPDAPRHPPDLHSPLETTGWVSPRPRRTPPPTDRLTIAVARVGGMQPPSPVRRSPVETWGLLSRRRPGSPPGFRWTPTTVSGGVRAERRWREGHTAVSTGVSDGPPVPRRPRLLHGPPREARPRRSDTPGPSHLLDAQPPRDGEGVFRGLSAING